MGVRTSGVQHHTVVVAWAAAVLCHIEIVARTAAIQRCTVHWGQRQSPVHCVRAVPEAVPGTGVVSSHCTDFLLVNKKHIVSVSAAGMMEGGRDMVRARFHQPEAEESGPALPAAGVGFPSPKVGDFGARHKDLKELKTTKQCSGRFHGTLVLGWVLANADFLGQKGEIPKLFCCKSIHFLGC